MIDTISIRLNSKLVGDSMLTNISKKTGLDGMTRYTGKLDNLVVTQNERSNETFIEGSLPIFYHGQYNLRGLYDSEYKKVFKKLTASLGLTDNELADATVLRVDLGCNILVSQPVSVIANKIVSKPHLSRVKRDNGVEFVGAHKKIIFYDKIAELRHKNRNDKDFNVSKLNIDGTPLPTSKHVLRVESQFKKMSALIKQIKIGRTVNDLFIAGALVESLREKFMAELESVEFEKSITMNLPEPETTKSRVMAMMLLQTVGKEKAFAMLNDWQQLGYIKQTTKTATRALLSSVETDLSVHTEDIKEMIRTEAMAYAQPDKYSAMVWEKVSSIIGTEPLL